MTTDFLEGVKMAEQHAKTFRLTNSFEHELHEYLGNLTRAFLRQSIESGDAGLIKKALGFLHYKDRLATAIIKKDFRLVKTITEDQEIKAD